MKQISIDNISDSGIIFIKLNDEFSRLICFKFQFKYNKIGFFVKNSDSFTVYTMNVVNEIEELEINTLYHWLQNTSVENIWIKKLNPIIINQLFHSEMTAYIQKFFTDLMWLMTKIVQKRDINLVIDNWLHILCTGNVLNCMIYYDKIDITEHDKEDVDKIEHNDTIHKSKEDIERKDSSNPIKITMTKNKYISLMKKQALTSFQIVNLMIHNLELEIKNIQHKKTKIKIHFPKSYFTYEFADKILSEKIFGKIKNVILIKDKINVFPSINSTTSMNIVIKFLELYSDSDFRYKFESYHSKKINYSEVITYISEIHKITNDNFNKLLTELDSGKISTADIIKDKIKIDEKFSKLNDQLGKKSFFNKFDGEADSKEYFIIPNYQKINKKLILCYNHLLECVINIKNGEEPYLNVNLMTNLMNLLTKKLNKNKIPFMEGEYSYKGAFVVKSIHDKPLKVELKSRKRILLTTAGKNDFSQFNRKELEEILLHLDNIADGTVKIDNLRSQLLHALSERYKT